VIYRFEGNTFDTERRELRRAGVLCPLEPQLFDLLEYLIRNRHRVVTRDDVLKAVWNGRIVSEAALDTRVSAARRMIGDDGTDQRLLKTVRTRGFRFVGEVQEEGSPGCPPSRQPEDDPRSRPTLLDRPRIAVLPFANITGDRKQGPFVDGLAEELITALSKVGWLLVASRASSFAYKGRAIGTKAIARELGVRYLLEGSIRKVADRARMAVRLVDGVLDQQIWAEQYDRDIVDIFAVHAEICDKVMAAVESQLYLAERIRAERTRPENRNAWECIVRALSLMNARDKSSAAEAHGLLQKAVSLEPESAHAHGLLSIVTTFRLHMGWMNRQDAVPQAVALARKAISLNPHEPWAHAALGYALIWKEPEEAIAPCMHAIALNSNLATGHYYLALACAYAGRCDQVFANADAAERLAQRDLLARGYPGAPNNVRSTGSFAIERYSEGAEFARRAILDAPSSPTGYRSLIMNLALQGQIEPAQRALRTLRCLMPEISQNWIRQNAVWASHDTMKRYVEAFRAAGLK
jgi:TolB-like protein